MKAKAFKTFTKSASIIGAIFLTSIPTSVFSETVAEYEAFSDLYYSVIGLRDLDGSPISNGALASGGFNDFEPNLTSYSLRA